MVLVLSYRFGWVLLKGPLYWGNDIPFALSYVRYIDRWWPYIPRWHYEWAGGMPLLRNYPFLITFITVWIEHLTHFTVVQIARFFFWFSIPLAGAGIMIFTRLITKNWLLAILAGVFSLLSPEPWLWIMQGGFYSASTSFPWMVFTFVFFELACQKEKSFWWVLAIIFFGLTWIAHPVTGLATSIALFIYGLGRGVAAKKILSSIFKTLAVCFGGILLISFWIIPFVFSRPGGTGISKAHEVSFIAIPELLGLIGPRDGVYITSGFFSGAIWFLAGLGLIFALIRRSKILIAASCALMGIIFIVGPGYIPWILKGPILTVWGMLNVRSLVIPRLFLPVLAAFGAISFGQGLFLLIGWFRKDLKKNVSWQLANQIIGGAIALIFVFFVFQKVVIIPGDLPYTYFYLGYGPVYSGLDLRKINGQWWINEGKDLVFPSLVDSLKGIINLKIDDSPINLSLPGLDFQNFIKEEGLTENDRIDIFEGSITASWNTVSGIAQVNPYVGTSLITPMIGYEKACLHYLVHTCNASEIQSLAKWWGLKIVYIGEVDALVAKPENLVALKKAGFQEKIVGSHLIYEIPNAAGLATVTNKPLILVIGDNPPFSDGFRTAFYSFNRSSWNYDKEMLIAGKRYIDDYTLEDLNKFPIIVLYGYQTHNKEKAWSMLSKYVEEGGSLFVDTGWQYWSQDWGKIDSSGVGEEVDMPDLLPVAKTTWQTIGKKWQNLTVDGEKLNSSVNAEGWADLTWEDKAWGLSLANSSSLREGSFPLVTTSSKVVVSGRNFGQGKIIWSGMNFFGHTAYHQSEAENEFLSAAFSFLYPNNNPIEENLNFKRQTPDNIIINVDKTVPGAKSVMFKEVAASGWRVFWQSGGEKEELPILRAGPGWKLVQLPQNSDKGEIIMTYGRTLSGWFYIFLSIITALGLVVFLLDGLLKGKIRAILRIPQFHQNLTGRISMMKKRWQDEDDQY